MPFVLTSSNIPKIYTRTSITKSGGVRKGNKLGAGHASVAAWTTSGIGSTTLTTLAFSHHRTTLHKRRFKKYKKKQQRLCLRKYCRVYFQRQRWTRLVSEGQVIVNKYVYNHVLATVVQPLPNHSPCSVWNGQPGSRWSRSQPTQTKKGWVPTKLTPRWRKKWSYLPQLLTLL